MALRLFLVPFGVLEILDRRHSAGRVLAERQERRRRLRLFFGDQDHANGPFLQAAGWFRKLDVAVSIKSFDDGRHGIHLALLFASGFWQVRDIRNSTPAGFVEEDLRCVPLGCQTGG